LVVSDITAFTVDDVFADGVHVAHKGEYVVSIPPPEYPPWSLHSVHVEPVTAEAFRLVESSENLLARVIRVTCVTPGQLQTSKQLMDIFAPGGEVVADPERDLLKLFVFDRYAEKEGIRQKAPALVTGTHFGPGCAYAATLGHDSHNLVVLGSSDEDLALATNRVMELQGGVVAVRGGAVVADLALPLAGLMSLEPIEVVVRKIQAVNHALVGEREGEFDVTGPLVFLSLVCVPQLHLSNRGLVELGIGTPPQIVTPFYPDGRFSPRSEGRAKAQDSPDPRRGQCSPSADPFPNSFDPFASGPTGGVGDEMPAMVDYSQSTSEELIASIFGPAPAGAAAAKSTTPPPALVRSLGRGEGATPSPLAPRSPTADSRKRVGGGSPVGRGPSAMARAAQRFTEQRKSKIATPTPPKSRARK
jgi:hypothetical protein